MSTQVLQPQQSQSLVMTQQLRQSIELLQLSTQELHTFVDEQLERNPLLGKDDGVTRTDDSIISTEQVREDQTSSLVGALDTQESDMWGDNGTRYHDARATMASNQGAPVGGSGYDIDQRLSNDANLAQELQQQLQCILSDPLDCKIAIYLVDMIDEAGYLPEQIDAQHKKIGVDKHRLMLAIDAIQSCEPTGIGARNLRECLALQLAERGQLNTVMQTLLDNLALIADGDSKGLLRACGVDAQTLGVMVQHIRACNPKPGTIYTFTDPQTLIPDVMLKKKSDDSWHVELNQDALPKVLMDKAYSTTIKSKARDVEERKVINQHIQHGHWLTRALDQRSNTLLAVATAIVTQQEDFFDFGLEYLKPMTLRDIAQICECHESTVSRVTTSKYIICARGTFELKYFFTSTLQNSNGGDDYSSRSVMEHIRQLVDAEPASKIMSDDAIAVQLQSRGINVARRTVVKYRKIMNIPSSVERRRAKKTDSFKHTLMSHS